MAEDIKRETTIHFPQEIIEKILYNLRVKPLLRFKCVSKRWRSIISSKEFIKRHLKKWNTNPKLTHHVINLKFHHRFLHGEQINPYFLRPLFDGPTTTLDRHPRREDTDSHLRMWGSCNGLVLLTHHTIDIYSLNFSTRKLYSIRSFHPKEEPGQVWDHFIYGLGYNESADEYKVVCVYSICYSKPYKTRIYSSKTLSWKRIENFDKGTPVDDYGKFVSGKLHWLAAPEGRGGDLDIVSLDLVEEKYSTVARPENTSVSINYQLMLGDLGGYLSLVSYTPTVDTKVWVMKEYGVRESWTKIWTLSDFADPKTHVRGAMPLFLKNNGDIAVAFGSGVVVCNGKTKLHESRTVVADDIVWSVVHVGSLVSPFGNSELLI